MEFTWMLETFLRYTSQPGWRAFTKEAFLWSFGFLVLHFLSLSASMVANRRTPFHIAFAIFSVTYLVTLLIFL